MNKQYATTEIMSKSKGESENFDVIKFGADDGDSWANFNAPDSCFGTRNGLTFLKGGMADDVLDFGDSDPWRQPDMVNSPAHYTSGRYEAIDVIEDAIEEAPSVKAGMLQAQALKYLLRLWHKIDAKEDAEKARWYLNRLIDTLN